MNYSTAKEAKSTEKQLTTKQIYEQEFTRRISLKLNTKTDADILEALEGKQKQTEIKRLIRKALAHN